MEDEIKKQKIYFTKNYLCTKTIKNWNHIISYKANVIKKINYGCNIEENELNFFLLDFMEKNKILLNKNNFIIITEDFLNDYYFNPANYLINLKYNINNENKTQTYSFENIFLEKKYIFIPLILQNDQNKNKLNRKNYENKKSLLILYENKSSEFNVIYVHFDERETEYANKIKDILLKFKFFIANNKETNNLHKFSNLFYHKINKYFKNLKIDKFRRINNDFDFIIIKIISDSILEEIKNTTKNIEYTPFEYYFKFYVLFFFNL